MKQILGYIVKTSQQKIDYIELKSRLPQIATKPS